MDQKCVQYVSGEQRPIHVLLYLVRSSSRKSQKQQQQKQKQQHQQRAAVLQPRRPQQRPTAEHIQELQRQQRQREGKAKEAGLPTPPPTTGKGGRGKLIFPQTDSYRFVLHIRELTQDRYIDTYTVHQGRKNKFFTCVTYVYSYTVVHIAHPTQRNAFFCHGLRWFCFAESIPGNEGPAFTRIIAVTWHRFPLRQPHNQGHIL